MAGPEPITPLNEGTSNQNATKSIIEGHDVGDEEIKVNKKGKAKVGDEDLSKPFKEVLKCPFTRRIVKFSSPGHRMPANAKIYDGTGDLEDHVGRFVGIRNQGEWPMPVWCRMLQQTLDGKARAWFDKLPPNSIDSWGNLQEKFLNRFGILKACDKDPTEISKIVQRANEMLPNFKEIWVRESNVIPNVPELMQISSFMNSHKCPELSKRISDNIPKTFDEMLKRVDDYLRSEEAFRNTELPKGEFQRKDTRYNGGSGTIRTSIPLRMPPPQLEIALESNKLNHLVKDVRQRGRAGQRNSGPQKGNVINMVQRPNNIPTGFGTGSIGRDLGSRGRSGRVPHSEDTYRRRGIN
ncbi:reverse transcriptase domain-containing protein [Tanacetum coccineum]